MLSQRFKQEEQRTTRCVIAVTGLGGRRKRALSDLVARAGNMRLATRCNQQDLSMGTAVYIMALQRVHLCAQTGDEPHLLASRLSLRRIFLNTPFVAKIVW